MFAIWNRSTNPEGFQVYARLLHGASNLRDSFTSVSSEEKARVIATVEAFEKEGRRGFIKDAADLHRFTPSVVHQIMAEYRGA